MSKEYSQYIQVLPEEKITLGRDTRKQFITPQDEKVLQNDYHSFELTAAGQLRFRAKASLLGVEPLPDPGLFFELNEEDYQGRYVDNHLPAIYSDFIEENACAKILGRQPVISEEFRNQLEQFVAQSSGQSLTSIQNSEHWWWQLPVYAKILGLDFNLPRARIKDSLQFFQKHMLERFKDDDKDYRPYLWNFGAFSSSAAQARILGVDIDISKKMMERIEQTIEKVKAESVGEIPDMALDHSILNATKIVVGGEKGLELYY